MSFIAPEERTLEGCVPRRQILCFKRSFKRPLRPSVACCYPELRKQLSEPPISLVEVQEQRIAEIEQETKQIRERKAIIDAQAAAADEQVLDQIAVVKAVQEMAATARSNAAVQTQQRKAEVETSMKQQLQVAQAIQRQETDRALAATNAQIMAVEHRRAHETREHMLANMSLLQQQADNAAAMIEAQMAAMDEIMADQTANYTQADKVKAQKTKEQLQALSKELTDATKAALSEESKQRAKDLADQAAKLEAREVELKKSFESKAEETQKSLVPIQTDLKKMLEQQDELHKQKTELEHKLELSKIENKLDLEKKQSENTKVIEAANAKAVEDITKQIEASESRRRELEAAEKSAAKELAAAKDAAELKRLETEKSLRDSELAKITQTLEKKNEVLKAQLESQKEFVAQKIEADKQANTERIKQVEDINAAQKDEDIKAKEKLEKQLLSVNEKLANLVSTINTKKSEAEVLSSALDDQRKQFEEKLQLEVRTERENNDKERQGLQKKLKELEEKLNGSPPALSSAGSLENAGIVQKIDGLIESLKSNSADVQKKIDELKIEREKLKSKSKKQNLKFQKQQQQHNAKLQELEERKKTIETEFETKLKEMQMQTDAKIADRLKVFEALEKSITDAAEQRVIEQKQNLEEFESKARKLNDAAKALADLEAEKAIEAMKLRETMQKSIDNAAKYAKRLRSAATKQSELADEYKKQIEDDAYVRAGQQKELAEKIKTEAIDKSTELYRRARTANQRKWEQTKAGIESALAEFRNIQLKPELGPIESRIENVESALGKLTALVESVDAKLKPAENKDDALITKIQEMLSGTKLARAGDIDIALNEIKKYIQPSGNVSEMQNTIGQLVSEMSLIRQGRELGTDKLKTLGDFRVDTFLQPMIDDYIFKPRDRVMTCYVAPDLSIKDINELLRKNQDNITTILTKDILDVVTNRVDAHKSRLCFRNLLNNEEIATCENSVESRFYVVAFNDYDKYVNDESSAKHMPWKKPTSIIEQIIVNRNKSDPFMIYVVSTSGQYLIENSAIKENGKVLTKLEGDVINVRETILTDEGESIKKMYDTFNELVGHRLTIGGVEYIIQIPKQSDKIPNIKDILGADDNSDEQVKAWQFVSLLVMRETDTTEFAQFLLMSMQYVKDDDTRKQEIQTLINETKSVNGAQNQSVPNLSDHSEPRPSDDTQMLDDAFEGNKKMGLINDKLVEKIKMDVFILQNVKRKLMAKHQYLAEQLNKLITDNLPQLYWQALQFYKRHESSNGWYEWIKRYSTIISYLMFAGTCLSYFLPAETNMAITQSLGGVSVLAKLIPPVLDVIAATWLNVSMYFKFGQTSADNLGLTQGQALSQLVLDILQTAGTSYFAIIVLPAVLHNWFPDAPDWLTASSVPITSALHAAKHKTFIMMAAAAIKYIFVHSSWSWGFSTQARQGFQMAFGLLNVLFSPLYIYGLGKVLGFDVNQFAGSFVYGSAESIVSAAAGPMIIEKITTGTQSIFDYLQGREFDAKKVANGVSAAAVACVTIIMFSLLAYNVEGLSKYHPALAAFSVGFYQLIFGLRIDFIPRQPIEQKHVEQEPKSKIQKQDVLQESETQIGNQDVEQEPESNIQKQDGQQESETKIENQDVEQKRESETKIEKQEQPHEPEFLGSVSDIKVKLDACRPTKITQFAATDDISLSPESNHECLVLQADEIDIARIKALVAEKTMGQPSATPGNLEIRECRLVESGSNHDSTRYPFTVACVDLLVEYNEKSQFSIHKRTISNPSPLDLITYFRGADFIQHADANNVKLSTIYEGNPKMVESGHELMGIFKDGSVSQCTIGLKKPTNASKFESHAVTASCLVNLPNDSSKQYYIEVDLGASDALNLNSSDSSFLVAFHDSIFRPLRESKDIQDYRPIFDSITKASKRELSEFVQFTSFEEKLKAQARGIDASVVAFESAKDKWTRTREMVLDIQAELYKRKSHQIKTKDFLLSSQNSAEVEQIISESFYSTCNRIFKTRFDHDQIEDIDKAVSDVSILNRAMDFFVAGYNNNRVDLVYAEKYPHFRFTKRGYCIKQSESKCQAINQYEYMNISSYFSGWNYIEYAWKILSDTKFREAKFVETITKYDTIFGIRTDTTWVFRRINTPKEIEDLCRNFGVDIC